MERKCGQCGTEIKAGAFGSIEIVTPLATKIINEILGGNAPEYCSKCGKKALGGNSAKITSERNALRDFVLKEVRIVPVLSIHSPKDWDYVPLEIVTAQSNAGTGLWTSFTSALSDFAGEESGSMIKKIVEAENKSFFRMIHKALLVGGNAVLGVDIDYAEVGGSSAILMVCTTGTAVSLKNTDVLGADRAKRMEDYFRRAKHLEEFEAVMVELREKKVTVV